MRRHAGTRNAAWSVVLLILGGALVSSADAACYPIGYASCPSAATQFCTPDPLDPTSSAQAQLACDTCYGTPCFLETADCAGPGWGPNPAGSYVCGDAYFGYTAGCSGSAGRVWFICSSYTTFGYWGGAAHCFNGISDGGETDVDCGGPDCASCCGNGTTQIGEQCDDGNQLNGDCCGSTCQYEPSGSTCATDGDACTDDVCDGSGGCGVFNMAPCDDGDACTDGDICDGAGGCAGPTPTDCDDNDACTADSCVSPTTGCVNANAPAGGCLIAAKSSVLIKNAADNTKDKLLWKWIKGAAVSSMDLADPVTSAEYRLCVYAGPTNAPLASAALPPGSGWSTIGTKGYKFKGTSPGGLSLALLKGGAAGKSKALAKGKGAALPDPMLPVAYPVTVQLKKDGSPLCLESTFTMADEKKNTATQFKAKH